MEIEKQEITVYWWNLGVKTLDYKGSYEGFLREKGIKVSKLHCKAVGWMFKVQLSSTEVRLKTFSNLEQAMDEAIKVFLTLLGDRATLKTPRRRYNLNW